MVDEIQIGIIGGSGLYNMEELEEVEEAEVSTPFGDPSGPLVTGKIRGKRVVFLPRHGRGHVYTPSEVNYRANIFALKTLGVRFIIGISACGSLKEEYAPGNIVIPDQLIDFTKGRRERSFFGGGIVAHETGATVHKGGNFITIEGPRFSTKGESMLFRQWNLGIIGMTTSPEAFLAREAEISYAVMAHVTDYDVWHEEPVSTEMVMNTFAANIKTAHASIVNAVVLIDENAEYASHNALGQAIMTARDHISKEAVEKLKPIVGKYLAD